MRLLPDQISFFRALLKLRLVFVSILFGTLFWCCGIGEINTNSTEPGYYAFVEITDELFDNVSLESLPKLSPSNRVEEAYEK